MTAVIDASPINLAAKNDNPLAKVLAYYHSSPKQALDGQTFHMYAGYYYYMITEGNNTRFLRATSHTDLAVKSRYSWGNVIGLERSLEAVLKHNLQQSPMTLEILKQNRSEIVWTEPDRELRNAEKRWLRVVQNVMQRLRSND
jgi:hypothetical protein